MCTVCGCGEGETRIEGKPADPHAASPHDHAHSEAELHVGVGSHHHHDPHHGGAHHAHSHDHGDHRPDGDHAHDHVHEHEHGHEHWHAHEHVHADGTRHSHPHPHAHSHGHAHVHAHGHAHDREHGHSHDHSHSHGHSHSHSHAHIHTHADGTTHSHGHGHSHSHAHGPGHEHDHDHVHPHADAHGHAASHEHVHEATGAMHFGQGAAGVSVAGMAQSRLVAIEKDILGKNDAIAAQNRARFAQDKVLALNLVSSPGSGKTTLLVETLKRLKGKVPLAVVEGDQETSADADRIRATGVAAIQVNTGKGCHLDADMVRRAADALGVPARGVLFVENVGNLVCPAGFDLGEAHKVVICSVTEGEDKPLKYPGMFAAAGLMVVSKIDLVPHLDVDVDALVANARRVNPGIGVIRVSSKSGEGMDGWLAWIEAARALRLAAE